MSDASPTVAELFISTNRGRRDKTRSRSNMVNSATDAAIAINSIEFMDLLAGSKNTADVRTYTQGPMQPTIDPPIDHSAPNDNANGSLWGFSSWVLGGGLKDKDTEHNEPNSTKELKQHTSHETVTEYVGRLWFLPESKGGIRFRETIRVLTISHNDQSSTVECTTQYHNGSEWVDCSKVICKFSSKQHVVPVGGNDEQQHDNNNNTGQGVLKVKMSLDSEILVWLPLPKVASKAVGKKIISAFETAALDFFEELASY